jgi:hypothetical protein
MRPRDLYAHTSLDDVTRLRLSFDEGTAWTKDAALRQWGWADRRFRATVSRLREEGYPVISVSEQGSVYRRAANRAELEQFIDRELLSRTRDLEAQIRALRDGADKHFGPDQLALAI